MLWGCILLIAAVLCLLILYFCYRFVFYYRDPKADPYAYDKGDQTVHLEERFDQAIGAFQGAACEPVSMTTWDGLRLTGRYYHVADGAPLQIQCHGYKGNAVRDFCGVWGMAQELGHNVLLIDERCHGDSEGHTITFGIREHRDVLSWIQYAQERFGPVPVLLMGVSMGAATVLMAAGTDLPDQVKGVVADCPYDSPANIIKQVGKDTGMPVKLMYPLIRLGGMLYGGFDLESFSPLEAVGRAKVPILLIHGDADRFVPYEMSCSLHKTASDKIEFHTIHGAGHALNQVADPEKYRSVLVNFVEKYVKSVFTFTL